MRLLLDTHLALWSVTEPERLSRSFSMLVDNPDTDFAVSAVSIWEIAIKFALRRGPHAMPISGKRALREFTDAGFEIIPVTPDQAASVDGLPPIHGDPFDRLLVAQALHEPLRLVTHDKRVAAYSNNFILV